MNTNPLYALATSDTARGLTADLWRGVIRDDEPLSVVWVIADDFTSPRANTTDASANNGWFIQDSAAGGTNENFTTVANPDGVVRLSATTGTDEFGIEAHYGESATTAGVISLPTEADNPRGDVVFETRINLTDQKQFYIGMSEPIVEFLDSSNDKPANSDYIGFERHDGGALVFVMANDNDGGTAVTDTFTVKTAAEMDALESATSNWCKLGFRVNKDSTVEISFNGEWFSPTINGLLSTALPIEPLTIKLAASRGATDDQATVELDVDYIYCAITNS